MSQYWKDSWLPHLTSSLLQLRVEWRTGYHGNMCIHLTTIAKKKKCSRQRWDVCVCVWTRRIKDGENEDEGLEIFTKIPDVQVNLRPPSQVRPHLLSPEEKKTFCLLIDNITSCLSSGTVWWADSDACDDSLFLFLIDSLSRFDSQFNSSSNSYFKYIYFKCRSFLFI